MADIFLGYAKEDRPRARVLAQALQAVGWSVFWDVTIPAGSTWEDYLDERLQEARCVVVAWSTKAVVSDWVKEEAREGKARGILVPVFFEEAKPPFGFRGIQGANLTAWTGGFEASEFLNLAIDIGRFLDVSRGQIEAIIHQLTDSARQEEARRQAEIKRRRSVAAKKAWETRRRRASQKETAKRKSPRDKRPANKTSPGKQPKPRKATPRGSEVKTIRVKMLKTAAGPRGNYPEGSIVTLPSDLAEQFIKGDAAEAFSVSESPGSEAPDGTIRDPWGGKIYWNCRPTDSGARVGFWSDDNPRAISLGFRFETPLKAAVVRLGDEVLRPSVGPDDKTKVVVKFKHVKLVPGTTAQLQLESASSQPISAKPHVAEWHHP